MRRTALLLALLAGALGLAAAGCGGEENKTATPETTQGSLPTQTTTTESTTTETGGGQEGDATAGKAVFTGSAGCTGCHTLADAGATGTVGPNLDQAKPPYDLVVDRVTNGRGAMPSFKGQLSEDDIKNVAAYVSSVAGQ